ncbi:MAG: hypothetical protein R6U70_01200 [Bacillota bacterium]
MAVKSEPVRQCPSCGSRMIGRIGVERYYCHDCCVEFDGASGGIYSIDDEGNLTSVREDEEQC